MRMEIKKHKDNFEVSVFEQGSHTYSNILTHDPQVIAQILLDLEFMGFPIEKAIKLFRKRLKSKDWLGF